MVDAYTRLDLKELAADAERVLELNRSNGNLPQQAPDDKDSGILSTLLSPLGIDN